MSYRDDLFATYNATHVKHLDTATHNEKLVWFRQYVATNYYGHLKDYSKTCSRVLEIGCNKGYLLSALASLGFEALSGIDLSPDDVRICRSLVPTATIVCEDAVQYLKQCSGEFDVIILKAVLEHVKKEDVFLFLRTIDAALRDGGTAIIDVPNMDWLFAQHERYMDFTHEVGFTRESLAQVLRNVFTDVTVLKGKTSLEPYTRKQKLLRHVLHRLINKAFYLLGEGMCDLWWDNRSIIAIVRKQDKSPA